MNILIISGLGADERAFSLIDYPKNWNITYFKWILPNVDETLEAYIEQINNNYGNSWDIIIGLSFGGVIAQEFIKHYCSPKVKLILISSVFETNQIPFNKLISLLVQIIPKPLLTYPNPILKYLFGIKTKKALTLWREIIQSTDTIIIKWAFKTLGHWQPIDTKNAIIIHGDNDLMIRPPQNTDYFKTSGGHFIIYENANNVSKILKKFG